MGKAMPERITKVVLTNIIYFLCHMLGWVETEGQEEIFNSAPNIDFDPHHIRDTKKEIFLADAFESNCDKDIKDPDISVKVEMDFVDPCKNEADFGLEHEKEQSFDNRLEEVEIKVEESKNCDDSNLVEACPISNE